MFDWFYPQKKTTTKKQQKNNKKQQKTRMRFCNLYLSELGTKLIDDKREEKKVNVYEIKFQSIIIYRESNSKEIALSLLFFILMLTAYKREEII